jgi:hypothetical protein
MVVSFLAACSDVHEAAIDLEVRKMPFLTDHSSMIVESTVFTTARRSLTNRSNG